MTNTYAFDAEIKRISGLLRVRLKGTSIQQYFEPINESTKEIVFRNDPPEDIKKNILNTFHYIFLAQD